ncbi:MAG: murein biosynthesis integral membrane protein MurJ [Desulfobacteraceae bacterium]|nr:murein biosynthesis integral membrane protein MurJ [Desulfobacteraceae bacterium]
MIKRMSKPSSKLVKSAGSVGAFTLVSRILGVVRDAVIALLLGASPASDAFFVAFRIPNLLRKFFSDGMLTLSFVPVFSGYLTQGGRSRAFDMARSCFLLLSVTGVAVVIAGIAFAPLVVGMVAPGFAPDSYTFSLTVLLTRIMMPYIACVCLMAVAMGVLNSLGHFAAPAAAPIVLNLVILLGAYVLSPLVGSPALALALGVVLGGMAQLALQVPFLLKQGLSFFKKTELLHPGTLEAGRRMLPSLVGAAGFQINIFVATVIASTLSAGSISYLYYAERLVQFPMALFAVSVSTVLLPELSRKKGANDSLAASEAFARALGGVFFITIPAMVGLVALREPVVSLLFRQGAFDLSCVRETALALLCFCLGLWAFSGTRLLVTLFHGAGDVATPFRAGMAAIGFNLVAGYLLGHGLGHWGLALSISAAGAINFFILLAGAPAHVDSLLVKNIAILACRSFFVSVIMYIPVSYGASLITLEFSKAEMLAVVAGSVIVGIVVYVGTFMAVWGTGFELVRDTNKRR